MTPSRPALVRLACRMRPSVLMVRYPTGRKIIEINIAVTRVGQFLLGLPQLDILHVEFDLMHAQFMQQALCFLTRQGVQCLHFVGEGAPSARWRSRTWSSIVSCIISLLLWVKRYAGRALGVGRYANVCSDAYNPSKTRKRSDLPPPPIKQILSSLKSRFRHYRQREIKRAPFVRLRSRPRCATVGFHQLFGNI